MKTNKMLLVLIFCTFVFGAVFSTPLIHKDFYYPYELPLPPYELPVPYPSGPAYNCPANTQCVSGIAIGVVYDVWLPSGGTTQSCSFMDSVVYDCASKDGKCAGGISYYKTLQDCTGKTNVYVSGCCNQCESAGHK